MTTPGSGSLGAVAHYNLLERLEPSGPGELFRARDTHRGRTVAVRLLPPSAAEEAAAREALVDQARTLVPLSHPNIIALFDAGEHEGRVYLVFEFIRGQSLRAEAGGRPMHPRRAMELVIQIADAVADAHAAGFLHGGLSADTVMVTARGHAKIPTFHLASQVGFDPVRSESALHDYQSPEELRGQTPDDRSDVYSIGAMAYELLTTRRPSPRGAAAPSRANPVVPPEVDDVVLRACAPNPANRPQTAAVLAAELRALVPTLESRGLVEGDDAPAGGTTASLIAMAVALLVLLASAALLAWWVTAS